MCVCCVFKQTNKVGRETDSRHCCLITWDNRLSTFFFVKKRRRTLPVEPTQKKSKKKGNKTIKKRKSYIQVCVCVVVGDGEWWHYLKSIKNKKKVRTKKKLIKIFQFSSSSIFKRLGKNQVTQLTFEPVETYLTIDLKEDRNHGGILITFSSAGGSAWRERHWKLIALYRQKKFLLIGCCSCCLFIYWIPEKLLSLANLPPTFHMMKVFIYPRS